MKGRIDRISKLIQKEFLTSGYNNIEFKIDDVDRNKIIENILNVIINHKMKSSSLININTEKELYRKIRMWWHRDKSKYLGPYLFNRIIFELLLSVENKSYL